MSDPFEAPRSTTHAVVPIDGAAGVVTVSPAGLVGAGTLYLDGVPCESSGMNKFRIRAASGEPLEATVVAAWARTHPSIQVGERTYLAGEAIPVPLLVLAGLPFALIPVGGCIGGAFGGGAIALNLTAARMPWPTPVKAGVMLATGAVAAALYLAVAVAVSGATS